MIYEGINFNAQFLSHLTEKQFIEHEGHHFKGQVNAKEKLKEAYLLIKKTTKSENPDSSTPAKKNH